ncbi:haloacid dehalogenase [Brevibacillus reuszeri]|uniref:Haloacid dehalogenase n=1 Tax=Brevibacillus reuszeri TaxID=54915 RepID=A0A0K9YLS8_9BACL|nr:HAD-IA family hydrolase [Brevibacillus reuszeri]KNB69616.1 phosphatase [Brevibacillus reuszeri]MED1856009.1 HAD-IA family hydrolase [Brevibacillus reuszeri]GED71327.1 haloacid dehalogenase [Brevibacillus reuszeri]
MNRNFHRAIIFDMDNTLLQSRINFLEMKRAIFQTWVDNGICAPTLEWQDYTASQLIEIGRRSERMTSDLESDMWAAVTAIEKEGMHGAVLEAHAAEVLEKLHQSYRLFILTNNAYAAAQEALNETKIVHYFDEVVAREQMTTLKPHPSGINYILKQYPDLPVSAWTMIGDSWIDGKAAQDGHVRFVAYHGKREEMERQGVVPIAYMTDLRELLELEFGE